MLSLPELESTYDLLAEAIDRAPPDQTELMLTKLVLLLAQDLGDGARVAAHIEAALVDL